MSETEFAVRREDQPSGGRYVIDLAPGVEAEMTYRRVKPDTIAIDHTGVPSAFGGRGFALKLVQASIDDARAEGTKIIPHCSYVVAQFKRHPAWADLLAR